MDRLLQSGDGRLVMCGRILIQLNATLTDVMEVGCIVYNRDHYIINYNFLSLIKLSDREQIQKLVKKPMTLNHVVKFDFENVPVFTSFFCDTIYFMNHLDAIDSCAQNGTSIIKMSTKSLKCEEIYQSKFKIIHFSINESKKISKLKSNLRSKAVERDPVVIKINNNESIEKKHIDQEDCNRMKEPEPDHIDSM